MKKIINISGIIIFLSIFINCLFTANKCNGQWIQVSGGMGNITIYSIAISGNNIFAGTYDFGVRLTTNNGINWTQTSLNTGYVTALSICGNNTLAGTIANGVYLSSNNGTNWILTSLNNKIIRAFALSEGYVFAGANDGVHFSPDSGYYWIRTSLNVPDVYSLAVKDNKIFAGTYQHGIHFSTNYGANWIQTEINNKYVRSIAVCGNNIFAGLYYHGVYLSTNDGINWIQTSLNDKSVLSLTVKDSNIFAGTIQNGVYLSTDNGQTWIQKNQGFGNMSVSTLITTNTYIFAGTWDYSVWRRNLDEIISGITKKPGYIPLSYSLEQNFPNPFNSRTTIVFQCPESGNVSLKIYDILGKEIAVLVNENLTPGKYEVIFNAGNLSSGIYFYKMAAKNFNLTKKMILSK